MSALPTSDPVRRARRWFWALTGVAILLAGALSKVLEAEPSPATGAAVAGLGVALAVVAFLDVRLLLALAGRLRPPSAGARAGRRPRRLARRRPGGLRRVTGR